MRVFIFSLLLGLAAACSHTPAEPPRAEGQNSSVNGARGMGGIHFSLHAPDADRVFLILMRTFVSTPVIYEVEARMGTDGFWNADFDLIPGEYRYFFLVDGSVTVEKGAGRVEQDDFGGVTGVLTVRQTPEGDLKTF